MKDHPQAHIIDLGEALKRSMTPRELTSGSIRNMPGIAPVERKQHGRITDLVRKDRCGVAVYEGRCDGKDVCLVEHGQGHWGARSHDGVVASGPLVVVLDIHIRDQWALPGEQPWDLTAFDASHDHITLTSRTGTRASMPIRSFLADGWRPVAT